MAKRTGKAQEPNIVKYRRPWNVNIGMLLFAVILIYLIISIFSYLTTEKVVGYEVKSGSLSSNRVFRGIALRQEQIVNSDYAGYVNYYNEEGDRIGNHNLVYTVDESGGVMDYINAQNAGETTFSDEALKELRGDVIAFTATFSPRSFNTVYEFKNNVRSTAQKLSSNSILSQIRTMDQSGLSGSIHYGYAPATGDIVYSTDGYETKLFADLTAADVKAEGYEKKQLANGRLVSRGEPVFKLCTDENWSITIEVASEEEAQALLEEEYVRIRFLKNQYESWAKVSTRTDEEGKHLVNLAFTNSMVTFCQDRYIDIEILFTDQTGLKVPNSAIVENTFFLVPKAYVTSAPSGRGVLRQRRTEDGTETVDFVAAPPYSETEEYYYLDQTTLRMGDVLVKPDSTETLILNSVGNLIGVYNINKGYADFRLIQVLYNNDEYSIIQPNSPYGLSEYDYIVLDASKVSPDQLIQR